jgi:hypothetical protein
MLPLQKNNYDLNVESSNFQNQIQIINMVSFKLFKKLLKKLHKVVSNIPRPLVADEMKEERKAARRNGMDFGPRPCCNGTPSSFFTDDLATLYEVRRENARLQELDEQAFWADDEKDKARPARSYESTTPEDIALENPFTQEIRTMSNVLASLHRDRINFAGFPTTKREQFECRNGRCRCLGPMMRDV